MKMYDVVIKNGKIYDGGGSPWYYGDIGINGEKITSIGKIDETQSTTVIDAKGMGVAPGFWDIHTHDDFLMPAPQQANALKSRILQGVTTCVAGNCGFSPFPLTDETRDMFIGYAQFLTAEGVTWEWDDFLSYSDYLSEHGTALNTAYLVGHGALRAAVMGFEPSAPGPEEMNEMKQLLEQAMDQGVFGMSTGLIYPPGVWSQTEELIELAKVVAEYNGFYGSHIRGHGACHLDGIREVIRIAEEANLPAHIHHMLILQDEWKVSATLNMIEEARNIRNVDITFDIFPYSSGNTTITTIYPAWALSGGISGLVERLQDTTMRNKIAHDIETFVPGWMSEWPLNTVKELGGWDNIMPIWIKSEKNKPLEGKTIAEIAKEQSKHPFDVATDLTIDENGMVLCVLFGFSGTREEDYQGKMLLEFVKNPYCSFQSDAMLVGQKIHPAGFGAHARILGRYVREMGILSMEEAIRKMTSLPASRLGIRNRGILSEGNYADIVVFNPGTINDISTIEDYEQYAIGVKDVIINGNIVVENGEYDNNASVGKVIKKTS